MEHDKSQYLSKVCCCDANNAIIESNSMLKSKVLLANDIPTKQQKKTYLKEMNKNNQHSRL